MAAKRAGQTIKVSVSVDKADLAVLKRRAREEFGGNLSAVIAEAAAHLRRQEAGWKVVEMLGGPTLTDEARAAIDAELAGGPRYEPKEPKPEETKLLAPRPRQPKRARGKVARAA